MAKYNENNIIIVTQRKDVNGIKAEKLLKEKDFHSYRMIYIDDMDNYLDFNNQEDLDFIKNSSVWFRRPDLYEYQVFGNVGHIQDYDERQTKYIEAEYKFVQRMAYINHYVSLAKRVLQVDKDVTIRKDKIFHLEYAKEIGFSIPDFIYSNKTDDLNSLLQSPGKTITKSIAKPVKDKDYLAFLGTTIVPTDLFSKVNVKNLDYPLFLQKYIESEYEMRITVVGKQIFACKLENEDKSVTDIRIAEDAKNVKHSVIDLPESIKILIFKFMEKIDIDYGCFDFLYSNGKYIFLEVNPMGQYMWIEEKSGLNITEGILEYLVRN
jgi:hypothetical protein